MVELHILCVDDDEAVLRATRRTLHGLPWRMTFVSDPLEALSILERGGVHILLTDQGMPHIDGISLCARARAIDPSTIRILLTGSFDRVSAREAVAAGQAECVVEKPWEAATLRRVIAEYAATLRAPAAERREPG